MTTYQGTGGKSEVEFEPKFGRITVSETVTISKNGRYADLSERDLRELALEILSQTHEVTYTIDGDKEIHLKRKVPPRPLPRVGEFYRVRSVPTMTPGFRDNPIVKIEVAPPVRGSGFFVRTAEGTGSRWYTMDNLEGPLDVQEKTVWEVK